MTFVRSHHQRIAKILKGLDANLLRDHRCLFGGGTAIALRYGEYRESVDIDFLVSDIAGYRDLRNLVRESNGIQALMMGSSDQSLQYADVRSDQYGIRTKIFEPPLNSVRGLVFTLNYLMMIKYTIGHTLNRPLIKVQLLM